MHFSTTNRRAANACVAALLALLTSCLDGTAPAAHGPDLVRWVPDKSFTVTTLGNTTVPAPTTSTEGAAPSFGYNDAGGQVFVGTGITIPANSSYRIRLNGTVHVGRNPTHEELFPDFTSYTQTGDWGPGGTASGYNDLRVLVKLRYSNGSYSSEITFPGMSGGVGAPDSALTDILSTTQAAEVYVARSGVGGKSSGVGFYKLESHQTVSVEQWSNFLHVTANPSSVHSGQQITFNAWGDAGLQPLIIFGWWWGNDPGSSATATGTCGAYAITCGPKNVYGPGTMCSQSQYGWGCTHVTTHTSFTLDVDRSTVFTGGIATFTPKVDGTPTNAARWRFVPDTGSDNTACADGVATCAKAMLASGTMWAYLGSSGVGDSASRHVTVEPGCGVVQVTGGGTSLSCLRLMTADSTCLSSGLCSPTDPDTAGAPDVCDDDYMVVARPGVSNLSSTLAELCLTTIPPDLLPKVFSGHANILNGCPLGIVTWNTEGIWAGEPAVYFIGAKRKYYYGAQGGFQEVALYGFVIEVQTASGRRKYGGPVLVDCLTGNYIGLGAPR